MDQHRVRTARSTDGKPLPHLFVELEPDEWMEIQYRGLDHAAIHQYLDREAKGTTKHIRYATRAFGMIIQDWEEGAPIA